MTPEPVLRLLRVCFGLSAEDAGRVFDLLGAGAFRFEPADAAFPPALLTTWRVEQWFGGRPVPTAAVAFVAVDPTARGRGHASRLLRRTLAEARAAGAALALLYPAVLPPYERLGFARAGVSQRLSCPPACFGPPRPDLAPPTRLALDDVGAAMLLRLGAAAFSPGALTRDAAMWTLALHPDGESGVDIYLFSGPDGPEGYLALSPLRDGRLTVADHCLLTGRAAAAAAGLLGSYRGRAEQVIWAGGPDDPLLWSVVDTPVRVEAWEEWMLRILDVPAALAARGYPPTTVCELLLKVDDDTISENQGVWRLTVGDGKGFVTKASDYCAADIRLSSSTLACLYSGYIDAAALRRMGRLEAQQRSVEVLISMFSGVLPHLSDRF